MNSLIETLNLWGGRIPNFAWPMLWQSSVLIAVLFAFDFATQRKVRASVRYAVWLVLLVKLLLPPSLALPTSLAWWVRSPAHPPKTHGRTTAFVVTYGNIIPASVPTLAPPIVELPRRPSLSNAGRNAAIWAAVGAGLLAWLMARWRKVAGDVHKAVVAPDSLAGVLNAAQHCIKLPRRVRLLVTKRAMSPAVCGLFRPVILLPQSLMERLTPSQLRAVLLHELAHLRRGDVWVNCAQALIQIFYWWHPLLWLANARIRRVREEAVDDAVMLALADDRETYAPTLLEVAKLAFNRPLASLGLVGILESRSALRQRIERLVELHPPQKAGLTILSSLCVVAFAAVAVPMEKAPPKDAKEAVTQKQTESASPPPVELSNENEEVKLRMIVLNKPIAGDAAVIRKVAEGIIAKVKGGASFSEMASVYSQGRQGREGGDWGWVQKYNRDGTLVLRKELADVAFSLKPGEVSGVIETPEAIYLMLVEDKRPAHRNRKIEAIQLTTPPSTNSRSTTNPVFTGKGRQAIVSKLDQIRLDSVLFDKLPLEEIVAFLRDEAIKHDPEKRGVIFVLNPDVAPPGSPQIDPTTGLPVAAAARVKDIALLPITIDPPLINVRLADVLEAIVKAAGNRVKYSIEEYAVVFSTKSLEAERLYTRTFQVNPKTFYKRLESAAGVSIDQITRNTGIPKVEVLPGVSPQEIENALNPRTLSADLPQRPNSGGLRFITRTNVMEQVSVAVQTFFSSLGVDLGSPEAIALGKSLFWKDRTGMFLIRATMQDLDVIERVLADLEARPENGINTLKPSTAVVTGSIQAMVSTNSRLEGITNKVPVLGDVPHIGRLFRSDTNSSPSNARQSSPAQLQTRSFQIDPNTFYKGLESVSQSRVTGTNAATAVRDFFTTLGVDLGSPLAISQNKSLFWNDRSGTLLVRATSADLDMIEAAIEVLNRPHINIKARFVEINRGDSKAFGFDWYLGNFLLGTGNTNLAAKESPQFHGILTDPQFRVVLRALEQRDGVDLLTTPEVITVSGRQAQIQVVDLQTVVTGINPQAQIPPAGGATNGMTNSIYQTQVMPIGPVLDVIPHLATDGNSIQLIVIPTVTEFLGYDDPAIYGLTNSTGQLDPSVLPLPRFRVRQMTVTAIVPDGQTLVLGGLVATEIIKKPDGSTETKDVSATQKKHLLIFITPTLVDEAGNRLHSDDGSSPGPK